MLTLGLDCRNVRTDRIATDRGHSDGRAGRVPALALGALVAVLALGTPESALAEDRVDFDQLVPVRFRYAEIYHRKPPSLSLRRNESRAVQPPTQYRTSSILQYSRPLGNTGMLLKVKAPLNPRKIIKIEIKF